MTGDNGVVPCGPDAGPSCADPYHRAIVVVDLFNDNETSIEAISVESLELLSADRSVETRARAWIDIERIEPDGGDPTTNPWPVIGAEGTEFDGTLLPGSTRLRVHAWLERPPQSERPRFRLTLVAGGQRLSIEGEVVTNAWPTG